MVNWMVFGFLRLGGQFGLSLGAFAGWRVASGGSFGSYKSHAGPWNGDNRTKDIACFLRRRFAIAGIDINSLPEPYFDTLPAIARSSYLELKLWRTHRILKRRPCAQPCGTTLRHRCRVFLGGTSPKFGV
jgi:hypothetical protein